MRTDIEPTNKGINQCSKYVRQVQQQRPELPTVQPTYCRGTSYFLRTDIDNIASQT